MPNNAKALPQPDIWPEKNVSATTKDNETNLLRQVHPQPRKNVKSQRILQQNDLKSKSSSSKKEAKCSSQSNISLPKKESSSISDKVVNETKTVVNAENGYEQSMAKSNSRITYSSKAEQNATKLADHLNARDHVMIDDSESSPKNPIPLETAHESSSIIDTSVARCDRMFSSLSLANVLGPKHSPENTSLLPNFANASLDMMSQGITPQIYSSSTVNAPSCFSTGFPLTDDLLSGPPPGFEDIHSIHSPPPGLSIPPLSESLVLNNVTNSDINKNMIPK
ncbi:hypothetical protein DICVIV_03058 [Dictyocaulus viviparus]|uniref:Uncharacterized protein n=1 Tax=Dictyocaulus viviparus TaxID=29172 RepID=A0A0D8Y1U3_DICVI|nr:hypothetical protein DICVIV_03058 [Dictyocaulus viviparus]